MTIASLVLAAAIAQAAAAAPEDPAAIPRGTPADEQLWHELRDAANGATIGMGRISQCSFRIEYGKYYEHLDAALQSGSEPERGEARALRETLAREARAAEAAIPKQPGIRECRYVLRDLGLQMPLLTEPAVKKQIPATRKQARACVKRLKPLSEKLLARANALEGALSGVDAFVSRRLASAQPEGAAPAKDAAAQPAAAPAAPAPEAKPAAPAPEAKP